MRARLLVFAVAVAIGIAWFAMRDPTVASRDRTATAMDSGSSRKPEARSQVAGIAARARLALPAAATMKPPSLRERFVTTSDMKGLMASLDYMAEVPLSERLLYKAVILDTCSRYLELRKSDKANVKAMLDPQAQPPAMKTVVGAPDPRQKAARAYLDERHIARECKGFDNDAIPRTDVDKAYADAADAGSLAARARMIEKRLLDDGQRTAAAGGGPDIVRQTKGKFFSPAQPTAEEKQLLGEALVSGDPVAIVEAGHVLTSGGMAQAVRIGSDDVTLMNGEYAFTLAACKFGYECGARNLLVADACASRGECADDFESYLRDWALPPAQFAQLQANAQAIADVIRRHDLGGIGLPDHPTVNVMVMDGGYGEPRMVTIH